MSITLTNGISISRGGSVTETDPQAAAMAVTIDYQAGSPALMVTLKSGNVSGLSLVPGVVATDATTISIDLTSGRWSATSGQSGTLSGGALTTLLTTLKTFRNTAENFAVNNGIVAGTQVAWT